MSSSYPSTAAEEFFSTWQHALSDDFHQHGAAASSSPEWVSEAAKIKTKAVVAALSRDGTLLALGVGDNIQVYDTGASKLLRTVRGYAGKISRIEFHPRGRKLVAQAERLVSIGRGVQFETSIRVSDLDEPDSTFDTLDEAAEKAASSATSILSKIWSSEDISSVTLPEKLRDLLLISQAHVDVRNERAYTGTLPSFGSRAFSIDGKSLIYFPERFVAAVLDTTTTPPVEKFRLVGHGNGIMWAEMSPAIFSSKEPVIATSGWDGTVRLWSSSSGEPLYILRGNGQMWGGAFSPDGGLVAVGSGDNTVRIWDTSTGELFHTLGGFTFWVRSVSFSPDGWRLAAGAGNGTLKVFNVVSGETEQTWQIDLQSTSAESERAVANFTEISCVKYSARGDLFFVSSEGRVFGYRAAANAKWEWMDPDFDRSAIGVFEYTISGDGSKLAAPFGSNAKIFKIAE